MRWCLNWALVWAFAASSLPASVLELYTLAIEGCTARLGEPDFLQMLSAIAVANQAAQQRAFAEGRKVAFVNAQTFWNDDSGALTRPPRSLGGNAVQWADMDLAELGLEPGAEKGALRGYE